MTRSSSTTAQATLRASLLAALFLSVPVPAAGAYGGCGGCGTRTAWWIGPLIIIVVGGLLALLVISARRQKRTKEATAQVVELTAERSGAEEPASRAGAARP